MADINTLFIGISSSFFYSVSPEKVPNNLSEEGHVFRIVQNAILLVFGERLVLCHKKGFAIKTEESGKSITGKNLQSLIDFGQGIVYINARRK